MAVLRDLLVQGSARFLRDVWGTTFHGDLDGNASTSTYANKIKTITNSTNANTYYLTFVDSNNSSATEESVYTTAKLALNPSKGTLFINNATTAIGADSASTIWLQNSSGYILVGDSNVLRRGASLTTGQLGSITYPWAGVYTKYVWIDSSTAGATAHINFTRTNYNYLNVPTGGTLAVSINGTTGATSYLAVDASSTYPGYHNNTVDLGTSSYHWKIGYINKIITQNYEISESTNSRLSIGSVNQSTAKGLNVGDLLVSSSWSDYTKIPTNGIYSKGVIKSGVAQGTAPFTVDSSTKVTNLNADLLDGINSTNFLYTEQVSQAQDNVTWAIGYANSRRRAFVYNTNSVEWSYLFGLSESNTAINGTNYATYGVILKMGYNDRYLRMLRVHQAGWYKPDGTKAAQGDTTGVEWEKIFAGYADNADKLDGYHFSDLESRYVKRSGDFMYGNLRVPNLRIQGFDYYDSDDDYENLSYGSKLNFGDGEYVYLYEYDDDYLQIRAGNDINIDTYGSIYLNGSSLVASTGSISSYASSIYLYNNPSLNFDTLSFTKQRNVYPFVSTSVTELVPLNIPGLKSFGYPLYTDPEFASGTNSVSVYNNNGNNYVTITREKAGTHANSSGYQLRIVSQGNASPGRGGFYQTIQTRANATFVHLFRANIPTGFTLNATGNSIGSGNSGFDKWLTKNVGTGKWEWYAYTIIAGSSGSFSSCGHVYLTGGSASTAVTWYLSYANVIDITKANYDGLRTVYADKLGLSNVGDASRPIYLNNGSPQQVTCLNGAYVGGYIGKEIDGYLISHPEAYAKIIIPFIYNDIAHLVGRGGSVSIYTTSSTSYTAVSLTVSSTITVDPTPLFDGSPSYWIYTPTSAEATQIASNGLIIDITSPNPLSYTENFYIDFGNTGWGFNKIDILVMDSEYDSTYASKVSGVTLTEYGGGYYTKFSHSATNGSTTHDYFNKIRIRLYDRTGKNSAIRIAQIGIISYNSLGLRNTVMSRGVDDPIFRSITPNADNTYDLGSSTNMFRTLYVHNIVGTSIESIWTDVAANYIDGAQTAVKFLTFTRGGDKGHLRILVTESDNNGIKSCEYLIDWEYTANTTRPVHVRYISSTNDTNIDLRYKSGSENRGIYVHTVSSDANSTTYDVIFNGHYTSGAFYDSFHILSKSCNCTIVNKDVVRYTSSNKPSITYPTSASTSGKFTSTSMYELYTVSDIVSTAGNITAQYNLECQDLHVGHTSSNGNGYIYFGDSYYVYLNEYADDYLKIHVAHTLLSEATNFVFDTSTGNSYTPNTVSGTGNFIIGEDCSYGNTHNFICGKSIHATIGSGEYNAIFGYNHNVGDAGGCLVFGYENALFGNGYSGTQNNSNAKGNFTLIGGYNNTSNCCEGGLIIGANNVVTGNSSSVPDCMTVLGEDNSVGSARSSLVVGYGNEISYCNFGFVAGYMNAGKVERGAMIGASNRIYAGNKNFLFGFGNEIPNNISDLSVCFLLGQSNKVTRSYSVCATAIGWDNSVGGICCAAIGMDNVVEETGAMAFGWGLTTTASYGTVVGKNNSTSHSYTAAFEVGWGSESSSSTVFAVTSTGNVLNSGTHSLQAADYAEYFEWEDGNPEMLDRVGHFVSISGNEGKIKIAKSGDIIIGIVSGNPGVIGNAAEMEWSHKYEKDIYNRRIVDYDNSEMLTVKKYKVDSSDNFILDEEGNMIPYHTEIPDIKYKLSDKYNPNAKYIPRSERPEWAVIGLLGQIVVDDDGTCIPGQKCSCNDSGIATAGNDWVVLKRLDSSHILVLFK